MSKRDGEILVEVTEFYVPLTRDRGGRREKRRGRREKRRRKKGERGREMVKRGEGEGRKGGGRRDKESTLPPYTTHTYIDKRYLVS